MSQSERGTRNVKAMVKWAGLFGLLILSPLAMWLLVVPSDKKDPAKDAPDIDPLPLRTALVERLSKESLAEAIENLPNFDEDSAVANTILSVNPRPQSSYGYLIRYVRLRNRIRRIHEEGNRHRAQVVALLKEKLEQSATGYDRVYKEDQDAYNAKPGRHLEKPTPVMCCVVYSASAAYLLSELAAHDALPMMAKLQDCKDRIPISRLFVFYAMHQLVLEYPRAKLSADAQQELEKYLAASSDIPRAQLVKVTAWNAALDDSDFRSRIVGADIGLEKQRHVLLRAYPDELDALEAWQDQSLPPAYKKHYERMRDFLHAAF